MAKPGGTPTDEVLLERIARRDQRAFELLYDRHATRLFSLAMRIGGDRSGAEEVTQEAFLDAWRRASTYRPELGAAGSWLLSIVRNRAIDRLRRDSVRFPTDHDDGAILDGSPALDGDGRAGEPAAQVIAAERDGRLHALIETLPRLQLEAVKLAYFGGLSQRQIAARTGVPLGTVKSRIRLALERIRLGLEAHESPRPDGASSGGSGRRPARDRPAARQRSCSRSPRGSQAALG